MNTQDLTSGGGAATASISGATAIIVNPKPGRLQKILVVVTTATVWTFYDSAVVTAPTDKPAPTVIAVIPSGTVAGTVIDFKMPAAVGIVAVPTANAAGQLTASFN